jgi:hypothetical protein
VNLSPLDVYPIRQAPAPVCAPATPPDVKWNLFTPSAFRSGNGADSPTERGASGGRAVKEQVNVDLTGPAVAG